MAQIIFDRSSYETYSDSVDVGVMAIGGNLTDTAYLSISVESLSDSGDTTPTHHLASQTPPLHFHHGFPVTSHKQSEPSTYIHTHMYTPQNHIHFVYSY